MKLYDRKNSRLADTAAESAINHSAQEVALESHLQALQDRYRELVRGSGAPKDIRLVPVDNSLIFINFMNRLRAKRTDSLTNRFFLLSIRPV